MYREEINNYLIRLVGEGKFEIKDDDTKYVERIESRFDLLGESRTSKKIKLLDSVKMADKNCSIECVSILKKVFENRDLDLFEKVLLIGDSQFDFAIIIEMSELLNSMSVFFDHPQHYIICNLKYTWMFNIRMSGLIKFYFKI